MNSNVISRVVGLVKNLRTLGFSGADWEDIEAAAGPVDRKELGKALTNAGAILQGQIWNFRQLDTDALMATPLSSGTGDIKLVSIIAKVPMGVWGKDATGRVRFVKDPHFIPSIENTDESDEDDSDDDQEPADAGNYPGEPRKGRLSLDL